MCRHIQTFDQAIYTGLNLPRQIQPLQIAFYQWFLMLLGRLQ